VNLNQFQFEFDLTWMAFFQNADGRTYLRYGGREDHDAETHLTKASLLRSMRQTLTLHARSAVRPASRYEPLATSVRTPEDIPPMQAMMKNRKVSCIHCHDVKVAQLRHARDQGLLRKDMVFTYPSASNLGVHLDADVQNLVKSVDENSPAAMAGVRPGDVIGRVNGQRVRTFADFSRVLELAPRTETVVELVIARNGRLLPGPTGVRLPADWRNTLDPSWRASGGVVGPNAGLWGVPENATKRQKIGLGPEDLAIKVTFIHKPWSRQAGMRLNDIIVSIDGQSKQMTTRQLQSYLHQNTNWGDTIELVILRKGKKQTIKMTFPNKPPD
jgi:predicted metalloprotease with PDZ domain